ncbi:MAG: TlpA family protein disulfide reductase [Sedimentisphaerales bacterium]|nr:TlpA family protein disulfide reductase [Sedimentisphaerales bacterium]
MIKNIGIIMSCVVVLAGCGKREEPAATNQQTSNTSNTETPTPEPMGMTADQNATEPQGQMAELPPDETTMAAIPTKLGDPAYPLTGLTYVKGEPAQITPGKVYVVEFWATWCPPCRTSIPHLTELRKKYEGQGVVFVGVSNEDVPTVKPFVTDMGDKMDYNVAVDTVGAVVNGYMIAFGQGGIPTAFVVDAQGRVVWYGHPMGDLEQVIGQVLAGTYKVPS